MIVWKPSNDICGTWYKFHMWQKGGRIYCCGIEWEWEGEEEEEEKVENDSDLDPDYKDNYDHGDD